MSSPPHHPGNLKLGNGLYLNDKAEKERRMDSVMELFPVLQDKRRDLASAMSGGQQQMLALGRGLMADPEALLLDEPTLGLAPIIVKEVFEKVAEISERLNTTIIVVEHNIKGVLTSWAGPTCWTRAASRSHGDPQSVRETRHLDPSIPGPDRQGRMIRDPRQVPVPLVPT